MTSNELRNQRAALLATAKQLINKADDEKRDLNEEERSAYEKNMQDVDGLKLEIERIERKEKVEYAEAELKTAQPRKVNPIPTNTRTQDIDRKNAIRAWALHGTDFADRSQDAAYNAANCGINLNSSTLSVRALSKGTTTAGGYTVPVGLQTEIEKAMKYYSNLRNVCRVWSTDTGNDRDWPTVTDTANLASVTTEASGIGTTTDPTFGKVTFKSQRYDSPIVKVSVELLQDSDTDIEALLADILVERIARKQELDFTTGAGGGSAPNGLVTGATWAKNLDTGNVVTFAKLKALEHTLDFAYRNGASFMMHDSTFAAVEQLVDDQHRPLFIPNLNDNSQYKLFGYPVHINNSMVYYTGNEGINKALVLFGNFQKFVIRDVTSSFQLVRFNELYAGNGQVGFLISQRAWSDYIMPSIAMVSLNSYIAGSGL